jgi:glyceraldehyde 3-phosphate dehydrogenase
MAETIRVGINGFGRIGRTVFRQAWKNPRVEIVAINDLADAKTLTHLLRYDSVHGSFEPKVEVSSDGKAFHIQDESRKLETKITQSKDPAQIPWKEMGADIVFECSGIFTKKEQASAHLEGGAKKVVISAPSPDPDIMVALGVNEEDLKPEHKIISNASCTTNCLAPLVKVLDQNFGIERGSMITVHSYTNDQRILDLGHKDMRRARAAAVNMIPTTTGAAKAVGRVWPSVQGKLDGIAVRVPTPNVSLVDFTAHLKKSTDLEEMLQSFEKEAQGSMKGILGVSREPLVSCDYNGNPHSSFVDAQSCMIVDGSMAKVISWYDNETGFSTRMVDLAEKLAEIGL